MARWRQSIWIKAREKNQKQRTAKGVKSGELTARETVKVGKAEKEVHQDVKDAKADGTVTADERKSDNEGTEQDQQTDLQTKARRAATPESKKEVGGGSASPTSMGSRLFQDFAK